MIIPVFGLAGSGKSSLVSKVDGKKINLDPGAEYIPYTPDFDVRDIVKTKDIILKENIGPNFAFMEAFKKIEKEVEIEDDPFEKIWVDLPGQFEVYLNFDLNCLKGTKVGVYLMDSTRDVIWRNFVIDNLLYIILSLKFDFPIIRVFSKADLITEKQKEMLEDWILGEYYGEEPGVLGEILDDINSILKKFYYYQKPIFVSINNEESIRELESFIEEVFCSCGDLT